MKIANIVRTLVVVTMLCSPVFFAGVGAMPIEDPPPTTYDKVGFVNTVVLYEDRLQIKYSHYDSVSATINLRDPWGNLMKSWTARSTGLDQYTYETYLFSEYLGNGHYMRDVAGVWQVNLHSSLTDKVAMAKVGILEVNLASLISQQNVQFASSSTWNPITSAGLSVNFPTDGLWYNPDTYGVKAGIALDMIQMYRINQNGQGVYQATELELKMALRYIDLNSRYWNYLDSATMRVEKMTSYDPGIYASDYYSPDTTATSINIQNDYAFYYGNHMTIANVPFNTGNFATSVGYDVFWMAVSAMEGPIGYATIAQTALSMANHMYSYSTAVTPLNYHSSSQGSGDSAYLGVTRTAGSTSEFDSQFTFNIVWPSYNNNTPIHHNNLVYKISWDGLYSDISLRGVYSQTMYLVLHT